ncbi:MAG: radical SAM protein [Deltaproteobacteria bacterium]|nr:radical SAM protein [Deltaproteobacteria bacterium]
MSLAVLNSDSVDPGWDACRTLTCSVLPVRVACNCSCSFCFSKSSISSLASERIDFGDVDVERYYAFSKARGATRLVITGGGEPLLRPESVVDLVARARPYFDEVAVFTNAARLSRALAKTLSAAGVSYLCWSRHHDDDAINRSLMGADAPDAADVVAACLDLLPIRLTTVMAKGFIDDRAAAFRMMRQFQDRGIEQFTFKHTYVAWERSLFRDGDEDRWAAAHSVQQDPFDDDDGPAVLRLPWGPAIRDISLPNGVVRAAFYFEPDPGWEKEHRLCRSLNLLSDGRVFASLEDTSSLLLQLTS